MVFADELSVRGILEGIRKGRTVVKLQGPDDPMIELDVVERSLETRVSGGTGATIRWVRNGREAHSEPITEDPFFHALPIELPTSGEDRWRAEVYVDGALRTITSNVFVGAPREEERGCGCTSARERTDFEAAFLFALILAGSTAIRLRSSRGSRSRRAGSRR